MHKHPTNRQPFFFLKTARVNRPLQVIPASTQGCTAAQRFVQHHLVLQIGEAGLHYGLLHAKLRALRVEPVELAGENRFFTLGPSKSAACGQHGVPGRVICWF